MFKKNAILNLGYCDMVLLIIMVRIILNNYNIYLEINGPLLAIGAILGLLTGDMTIYNLLDKRL